jgi:hypothetical protein
MNDIVAFLRARLDEDEAAAKKATGEHWEFDGATVIYGHALEQVVDYVYDDNQEHIARHDPARVLREVEAKRRIVDEHPVDTPWRPEFGSCETCADEELGGDDGDSRFKKSFPCPTIRLLALPYSDHPDYDPAWKV